ncbi:MAG: PilZ domain-containing protein [Nitrospirae bacterium]|nr:PilZ domain-containing protein [Nitrospirota bacterium]
MDDVRGILGKVTAQKLPLDLLFDGGGPGCAGRLLGIRRLGDTEGLAFEVTSGDVPQGVAVVRVRVVVERALYEFAVPVVRQAEDIFPVFVTRSPSEIHTVERRTHPRVTPSPTTRLRAAMTMTGPWIQVELYNISQGGAAFSSSDIGMLTVGHTVPRLELTLDDGNPILTSGTVRNVFMIRYPREIGPVYGIQWGRLSAEEQSRLTAYIAAKRS